MESKNKKQKKKVATFGDVWKSIKKSGIDLVTNRPFYEALIDYLVLFNCAFVGMEVDMPDMVGSIAPLVQVIIAALYILEFLARFAFDSARFLKKLRLSAELLAVLVTILGAFVFTDNKLVWRLSAFRFPIRCTRVIKMSFRSMRFADLWLVLAASWRSLLAIRWLALIFFFASFFFGSTVRGLVFIGEDDLPNHVCGGDDFRVHLRCIDFNEYFGSIPGAMFTMFQLSTLDRWAGHIVRPVAGVRPEAAAFMTCFVLVAFYAVLSIFGGVLVWSTVETAKQHKVHRDNIAMVSDDERIKDLREYFQRCLILEEREKLDFREIKEAMAVPQVKKTFDELALPVADVQQLWEHLDEYAVGDITLDRFQEGCRALLEPAKRFDMAILSARLNGRSQFAENLGKRCDVTTRELDVLFKKLTIGFTQMRKHVLSNEVNDIFPEVGLRRAGRMTIPRNDDY